MGKHSEYNSKELMSNSHDSLSKRQAFLFSFKKISFKEGIASDNAYGHKVDNSSEMTVASFRYPACAFKFTGLIDSRVNACKGDKGLMGREIVDITYLSKESGSCSITDTVDGSNDFHLLDSYRLTKIGEDAGDFIELLHKVKERRDFLRQNKFLSEAIGSDRVFSGKDNIIGTDGDLPAFTAALKRLCNNFSFSSSDKSGRGEFLKKHKHSSSKDITDGLQFREGALQNTLNLVFGGGDKVREGFSFSCDIPEVFSVLRDRELLNGILMNEKEPGDSKGVFFVGLGFTQRQLGEIGDQKGINDNSLAPFVREERKEINMVTACGFHACHDSREIFTDRSNSLHQVRKTAFIHSGRDGKTDIAFGVNACSRERILGNINTDEHFSQSSTSVKRYLNKAGEASRPILHDDKGSMTQSTYYGYGRQGTDSLEGSKTQGKWSSPACPTLTGKTSSYKFYNTYS